MKPPITRRDFVMSLAVAAGVLAVAPALGSCGRRSSEDAGALVTGSFISAHRGGTRCGYGIALPTGRTAGLPVVVVLHGRGADHRAAFGGHLELDTALRQGGHRLAVAAVDGGDTYWHRRATGEDSAAMVTKEFLPLLTQRGLDTTRIGLLGWSMGGFGVLSLAAHLGPTRVVATIAESPAIWHHSYQSADGAFDDPADWARHDVFSHTAQLRGIAVRVDCGRQDGFYAAARDYAKLEPRPVTSFGPGQHDESYWRATGPAQLDFLARYLR